MKPSAKGDASMALLAPVILLSYTSLEKENEDLLKNTRDAS